ncbi:MAG: acyloxyacyl hydrolase [Steroidobacter sp.]
MSARSGYALRIVSMLVAFTALARPVFADNIIDVVKPTAVFVQAGIGDNNTQSYTAGVLWDWNWRYGTKLGAVTGYSDISAGRWIVSSGGTHSSTWATQLGVTPVLRQHLGNSGYFAEIGIGANYILPLYQSGSKRFSTQFNFGDHAAVGKQFGQDGKEEIALRFQHYSNAGIAHPNPGENFFQLRYVHRF